MNTETKNNSERILPGFNHLIESAVVFGTIGGLADAGFLISTHTDLASSLPLAIRFIVIASVTSFLVMIPWIFIVLLCVRFFALFIMRNSRGFLTAFYAFGLLPIGLLFARSLAVSLTGNYSSISSVIEPYFLIKYLWLIIPACWLFGSSLAYLRINYKYPVLFGRVTSIALALTVFFTLIPFLQVKYILANGADVATKATENFMIIGSVTVLSLILIPILSFLGSIIARPMRGWVLGFLWIAGMAFSVLGVQAGDKALIGTPPSNAEFSGRKSNVILISMDTTRYCDLACFGSEIVKTPKLDEIAGEGVCFDKAVTPIPVTGPAHMSVMTGLQPDPGIGHGVRANSGILPDNFPTLATILDSRGYETGAIIGATPLSRAACGLERGFHFYHDEFDRYPFGKFVSGYFWSLTAGKVVRRILLFMGHNPIWLMKPGDVVTSQAIDWLSENSDKPFFLFVHYYDPHEPLDPSEPYASMYPPDTVDPESKSYEINKYLADLHALYRGEVTKMDESIGDLFNWLNDDGLVQNTLVIIFADHGESFEHKYYGHTDSIYNYVTHVPMIVLDPDAKSSGEKGTRVETLVNLTDIFYTVLGFLKIDYSQFISLAQKDVRGAKSGWNHNLLGLIENPNGEKLSDGKAGWNYVPTQSDLGWSMSETSRPRYFGFMFPGNNLIYTPGCSNLEAYFQYYDIDNDPGEDNDFYQSVHWAHDPVPDAPELLAGWASNQSPSSSGSVNPQIREQLKALGYVN